MDNDEIIEPGYMRQIDRWSMNSVNMLVRDNNGRWCLYADAVKLVEDKKAEQGVDSGMVEERLTEIMVDSLRIVNGVYIDGHEEAAQKIVKALKPAPAPCCHRLKVRGDFAECVDCSAIIDVFIG